jgi:hypothetical protein
MNQMFPARAHDETSASVRRSGDLPRHRRIRALPVRVRPAHGDNQDHIEEDRSVGGEEIGTAGEEGLAEGDEDGRRSGRDRQEDHQEDHQEGDEEGHVRDSDLHGSKGCPYGKVDVSARHRRGGQVDWRSANGRPSVEDIDVGRETIGTRHYH